MKFNQELCLCFVTVRNQVSILSKKLFYGFCILIHICAQISKNKTTHLTSITLSIVLQQGTICKRHTNLLSLFQLKVWNRSENQKVNIVRCQDYSGKYEPFSVIRTTFRPKSQRQTEVVMSRKGKGSIRKCTFMLVVLRKFSCDLSKRFFPQTQIFESNYLFFLRSDYQNPARK